MVIDLTMEEALAMSFEEVDAYCQEHKLTIPGRIDVTDQPDLEAGVFGGDSTAFPDVARAAASDHVVENRVTRQGLRLLRITRLGSTPEKELYLGQVQARPGAYSVTWTAWKNRSGGQLLHYLMIMWREG